MSVSDTTPRGSTPRLLRAIFGGAGPRINRDRRYLIDEVRWHLERWRDCDDPESLAAARRLLEDAS